jgi:hypothetical protein
MGRDFVGTYDLFADALLLFERGVHDRVVEPGCCSSLNDTKLWRLPPKHCAICALREPLPFCLFPLFLSAWAYRDCRGKWRLLYCGSLHRQKLADQNEVFLGYLVMGVDRVPFFPI